MLVTLALVIFLAAIATLFSQEFISLFKKIALIKGAKLFIPLVVASWVFYKFDHWFVGALQYYRIALTKVILAVFWILPQYQIFISISIVLVLTVISLVPVVLLDWVYHKQTYKPYPHPYLTSTFIWLISAIAITVI